MARHTQRSRISILLLIVLMVFCYWYIKDSEDLSAKDDWSRVRDSMFPRRRFAIVSMTTAETSYDHLAISNKFQYAEKHGYYLKYDFRGVRTVWDKLTDIESVIKEDRYDWIWWLDYDTLITNSSITLDDIVDDALAEVGDPNNIDIIATPDCWPLNAGSMLFRSTPWVLDLFNKVWKCGRTKKDDGGELSEQDCLRDLIKDNVLSAGDKSVMVKQWKLNAFPKEIECREDSSRPWEPGMFVVHFAGAWAYPHLEDMEDPTGYLMRKYSEFIE